MRSLSDKFISKSIHMSELVAIEAHILTLRGRDVTRGRELAVELTRAPDAY